MGRVPHNDKTVPWGQKRTLRTLADCAREPEPDAWCPGCDRLHEQRLMVTYNGEELCKPCAREARDA